MDICKQCKHKTECLVSLESDFCLNYTPRPLTHADKFRSMSDEELADFYSNKLDVCPPEHDSSKCIDELYAHGEGPYPSDKQCIECWLNWLREEDE